MNMESFNEERMMCACRVFLDHALSHRAMKLQYDVEHLREQLALARREADDARDALFRAEFTHGIVGSRLSRSCRAFVTHGGVDALCAALERFNLTYAQAGGAAYDGASDRFLVGGDPDIVLWGAGNVLLAHIGDRVRLSSGWTTTKAAIVAFDTEGQRLLDADDAEHAQ